MRKLASIFFILTITLFTTFSFAKEVEVLRIIDNQTTIGKNSINYPQLTGLHSLEIESQINSQIILNANISTHMVNLATIPEGSPIGLNVTHTSSILGDAFFTVITVDGKQLNNRNGNSNIALGFDLTTGKRIELSDLFIDVPSSVEALSSIIENDIIPEISSYASKATLLPLPTTSFSLDQYGITFYYPPESFTLLNGKSGSCHFFFEEILPLLRTDQESILSRMDILDASPSLSDSKASVSTAVTAGHFPCLPLSLRTPMIDVFSIYTTSGSPDHFPMGAYYSFEDSLLREVYLISDTLQSEDGESILKGIQLRRGGLGFLKIGSTTLDDWRKVLGSPYDTITLNESLSYDYRLPQGKTDIYLFGENELRLHSDDSEILFAIQINVP